MTPDAMGADLYDTLFLAFPNMEQGFESILYAQRLKIVGNRNLYTNRKKMRKTEDGRRTISPESVGNGSLLIVPAAWL